MSNINEILLNTYTFLCVRV